MVVLILETDDPFRRIWASIFSSSDNSSVYREFKSRDYYRSNRCYRPCWCTNKCCARQSAFEVLLRTSSFCHKYSSFNIFFYILIMVLCIIIVCCGMKSPCQRYEFVLSVAESDRNSRGGNERNDDEKCVTVDFCDKTGWFER